MYVDVKNYTGTKYKLVALTLTKNICNDYEFGIKFTR